MKTIKLTPVYQGNQILLTEAKTIVLGRTEQCGCPDSRVSRKHLELCLKTDGTVWIRGLHDNPTFYKKNTGEIVRLTKNKDYQLFHDDQFGFLPDDYFFQLSISNDDEVQPNVNVHQENNSSQSTTEAKVIVEKEQQQPPSIVKGQNTENVIASSTNIIEQLPTSKKEEISESRTSKTESTEFKRKRVISLDDDQEEDESNSERNRSTSKNHQKTNKNKRSKRDRCSYGAHCYRTNPIHRQTESHPGDSDWEETEDETDRCPHGDNCYRKNPEHIKEFHPEKLKSLKRKTTRKEPILSNEEDDDGLPNEYDYNDSFIDDEDLNSTQEEIQSDGEAEWKPHKSSRYGGDTEDDSSDESDFELTRKEAKEFISSSRKKYHRLSSSDDD